MKNKGYIIVFVGLLCLLMGACTQYKGRIGDLFGSWVLREMTIDGASADALQYENTYWSFQNSIIHVVREEPGLHVYGAYGSFVHTGDELIFDFAIDDIFYVPEWLGFPADGKVTLNIAKLDSHWLEAVYIAPDGKNYHYKFEKTW